MSLVNRDTDRSVVSNRQFGIMEDKILIPHNDNSQGKVLLIAPLAKGREDRATRTYEVITRLNADGRNHAEVLNCLSTYIEMSKTGEMITVTKCKPALADDLVAWCRQHRKLFHYCVDNSVFALVI